STRQFSDGSISNGERYPFEFDHRHTFNILAMFKATKSIDLNATWYFATGGYTTLSTQQTKYIFPRQNNAGHIFNNTEQCGSSEFYNAEYYDFGKRNNYKMKPSHRLNLSVDFHKKLKHSERIWNISVMNVYNNKNQDMLYTEIYKDDSGRKLRKMKQFTLMTIVPSASLTYKF
ncbi:MAG: hypothetical protein IIT64_02180, partial [Bacteroidaceae bacterium]|nr:hypothetical protein [Bacteroidaceae bacterium]